FLGSYVLASSCGWPTVSRRCTVDRLLPSDSLQKNNPRPKTKGRGQCSRGTTFLRRAADLPAQGRRAGLAALDHPVKGVNLAAYDRGLQATGRGLDCGL